MKKVVYKLNGRKITRRFDTVQEQMEFAMWLKSLYPSMLIVIS